jgi:hypothetical protein
MHLEDHAQLQMILQVAADAGQVMQQRDAPVLQQIGRADAGALQDGGRADGAGGEQGFDARRDAVGRAIEAELDAARLLAPHDQLVDQRAGDDLQVGPVQHRPQHGLRRIPAHALLLVHLEVADAEIVAAVVVA